MGAPRVMATERGRHRWWLRTAGAGASIVLLGALATAARSALGERREHVGCAHPATPPLTTLDGRAAEDTHAGAPAEPVMLSADVDGDGCDDPLVRTGNVLAWNGLRFSVGEPGDVVLVGDWDCDGVATAAVWRPAGGVAFVFEGWASAGEELAPAGRVSLRPGGGPPAPCRG